MNIPSDFSSFRKITDWSEARILVSNDDGIHAPGLKVLEAIARKLSPHVWVVAPETEQSGAGHSLSLHAPLRPQMIEERRYSIKGTPTDCVLFAYEKLMDRKIDLVLSGVNRGSNVAEDITHSGTIAAAMEGTLCGVPSIAMSLAFSMWDAQPTIHWDIPESFGEEVIRKIMSVGLPANVLMNVNFPDCPPAECKGMKFAPTGRRHNSKQLDERFDAKHRPYYWIHWGDEERDRQRPGVDLSCVADKYISLTPINLDLTDYKVMEMMREHF